MRTLAAGMVVLMAVAVLVSTVSSPAVAAEGTAEGRSERIEELERTVRDLVDEIKQLKKEVDADKADQIRQDEEHDELADQVETIQETAGSDADWWRRFTLGGYGEMHANFGESDSPDQFDIHRLVMYLGYDFNEWISLHSEIEIEHAFVSDGDGDLVVEQAHLDMHLNDTFNARVGRVLTPLGIINQKHEPTTFNGVERPSFAKYIIPSTWSSDGAGIFGSPTDCLSYEAYVVGGLDGSMFDDKNGVRDGRIKERPSLHDPAVTGRIDLRPLANGRADSYQSLRLGVSAFAGGIDNGDQGKNPDIHGDIQMYSGDFEYSCGIFDARGVVAHATVDEAAAIGTDAGSELFGWYIEGACHILP